MFRVLTDHSDCTLSFNNLAFLTNRFYWRSYLHFLPHFCAALLVYKFVKTTRTQTCRLKISIFLTLCHDKFLWRSIKKHLIFNLYFFRKKSTCYYNKSLWKKQVVFFPVFRLVWAVFSDILPEKTAQTSLIYHILQFGIPGRVRLLITPYNSSFCQIIRR